MWFKVFFQAAIAARNGRQATEPDIDAGTANMSDQHDTHSQPVSSASLEFQRLVYVVRKLIALQSSTSVDQHIMLDFLLQSEFTGITALEQFFSKVVLLQGYVCNLFACYK